MIILPNLLGNGRYWHPPQSYGRRHSPNITGLFGNMRVKSTKPWRIAGSANIPVNTPSTCSWKVVYAGKFSRGQWGLVSEGHEILGSVPILSLLCCHSVKGARILRRKNEFSR